MPPKRRSTSSRNATAAPRLQSTLSFNGKNHRVTKPSKTSPSSAKGKGKGKKDVLVEEDVAHVDVEEPTTTDKAILQQAEQAAEHEQPSSVGARGEGERVATYDEEELEGNLKAEDVLGGRAEQSEIGATGAGGSGWVGDEEQQARKITKQQIERYWRAKEAERLVPRVHQGGLGTAEKVLREWDMSGQYGPCIGIARLKRWKRANVLGLKPPVEVLAVLLQEMDKGDGAKVERAHVDELMSSRFVET